MKILIKNPGPTIMNILKFAVKNGAQLLSVSCDFIGEFQTFTTDFRSMTKHSNSVKPNLSITVQHESCFTTCTILEAHQYYHGYVVKVNAKNFTTLFVYLHFYQQVDLQVVFLKVYNVAIQINIKI